MQKLRAETAKRKLAEAVRHRWPEFSTETPQESGGTGVEMRFPCALICSVEDKVIVSTPEKKGNIRTATCSRFGDGDVPEEGSKSVSLANNEQADLTFSHIDIILHVVKRRKKKTLKISVSKDPGDKDLYCRSFGHSKYAHVKTQKLLLLSLDMNRI